MGWPSSARIWMSDAIMTSSPIVIDVPSAVDMATVVVDDTFLPMRTWQPSPTRIAARTRHAAAAADLDEAVVAVEVDEELGDVVLRRDTQDVVASLELHPDVLLDGPAELDAVPRSSSYASRVVTRFMAASLVVAENWLKAPRVPADVMREVTCADARRGGVPVHSVTARTGQEEDILARASARVEGGGGPLAARTRSAAVGPCRSGSSTVSA